MHILELTNGIYFVNKIGIGIFEYDQAKALAAIGEKVTYVGLDMRSILRFRKFGYSRYSCDGMEIYGYDFPLGRLPRKFFEFFQWQCFKKVYKRVVTEQGKPDVIHAHFGRDQGRIALRAKKKYGINYVITEHDSSINSDAIDDYDKKLLKKVYASAQKNISVSQPFCDKLKREYCENFAYIPNIADVSSIEQKTQNHGTSFVAIGGLIYRKGFDVLINAFSKIKNPSRDKLYIIGEGVEKPALQKQIDELDLSEKVVLVGRLPRNEYSHFFDDSCCFVLTTRAETFGIVYIEAMAAGLPVIATKCGGPESFVTDKVGNIVPVDDIDATVQAMEYMLEHHAEYDSKKIRQYVIDNFSPEVIAKKLVEVMKIVR